MPPANAFVYWMEYVIRHNKAKHLRPKLATLPQNELAPLENLTFTQLLALYPDTFKPTKSLLQNVVSLLILMVDVAFIVIILLLLNIPSRYIRDKLFRKSVFFKERLDSELPVLESDEELDMNDPKMNRLVMAIVQGDMQRLHDVKQDIQRLVVHVRRKERSIR